MEIQPARLLPLDAELPDDTIVTESVAAHTEIPTAESPSPIAMPMPETSPEPEAVPTVDIETFVQHRVDAFNNDVKARTGRDASERSRDRVAAKARAVFPTMAPLFVRLAEDESSVRP